MKTFTLSLYMYIYILCIILLGSSSVICEANWIKVPTSKHVRQNVNYTKYISLAQDPITRDKAAQMINPAFFVMGFPKCGTSSLYHYFIDHTDTMNYGLKEGNFFISKKNPDNNTRTEGHLQHLHDGYPPRSVAMSGDFSILYAYCAKVPVQVHSLLPTSKIIVSLREPVSRAKSHFSIPTRAYAENKHDHFDATLDPTSFANTMRLQMNVIKQCRIEYPDKTDLWRWSNCYVDQHDVCFKQVVHSHAPSYYIVAGGMYVRPIELWMNQFSSEQFLFITINEMSKDAQGTMDKVFDFIGIGREQIHDAVFNEKHDAAYDWKIEDTAMEFVLSGLYENYNIELLLFLHEHGHGDVMLWDF